MKPATLATLRLLRDRPSGVTALEALHAGVGDSLAQRVHELREAGHVITWTWETTPKGARVKRYALVSEPVYAGTPVGTPRPCPSCRHQHEAGRTCAWPATLATREIAWT